MIFRLTFASLSPHFPAFENLVFSSLALKTSPQPSPSGPFPNDQPNVSFSTCIIHPALCIKNAGEGWQDTVGSSNPMTGGQEVRWGKSIVEEFEMLQNQEGSGIEW